MLQSFSMVPYGTKIAVVTWRYDELAVRRHLKNRDHAHNGNFACEEAKRYGQAISLA